LGIPQCTLRRITGEKGYVLYLYTVGTAIIIVCCVGLLEMWWRLDGRGEGEVVPKLIDVDEQLGKKTTH